MGKSTSSARAVRLNNIMRQLLFHREVEKDALMEASCANTRRTFERDLQFLRTEHGADIVYDSWKKTYRLKNRGSFVPTFPVSEREVMGLMAGIKMASHVLPYLKDEMTSLWSRIKAVLPEELAQKGEAMGDASVLALPVTSLDQRVFESLVESIRSKSTVRLVCSTAGTGDLIVSPWELFFQGNYWYLWGSHDDRPEGYTYPLHEIKSLIVWDQDNYVTQPDEGNLCSGCWTGPPGTIQHEVSILVLPPLSSVVNTTLWHPTQSITRLSRDAVLLEATVGSNALETVARWIMARAPLAIPQSPERLVDKVKNMLFGLRRNMDRDYRDLTNFEEAGD
jgi:hypothetical protein